MALKDSSRLEWLRVLAGFCLLPWADESVGQPLKLTDPFEGMFPSSWEDFVPELAKLNTEDAAPADLGVLEVEFAYSHTRAFSAWDNRWHEGPRYRLEEKLYDVALAYGLWDDWELGIGWTAYSTLADCQMCNETSGGVGDLEIGAKYRFWNDESRGFGLASVTSVMVPTGKAGSVRDPLGHSQEFWTFNQRFAATKQCGRWTWSWDVGYALPIGSERGEERGTLDSNVALGYHIAPWFQPEVELNYAHDFIDEGQDGDLLAVTYGVIMPLSDKWRVELGFQQAIAGRNADDTTTGLIAVTYLH